MNFAACLLAVVALCDGVTLVLHASQSKIQVRARMNPQLDLLEKPLPADDPRQRQPDIALAQRELGWQPQVSLEQGLEPTIAWFQDLLG